MTAKSNKSTKSNAESTDQKKNEKTDKSQTGSSLENQDTDQGEELDALLELLDNEDLGDIEIQSAVAMIDHWHDTLDKSDEPEMKEMAKALKSLKKTLSSKKPKAEDIAKLMEQLGSEIDDFATAAKRGYKTKLHTLGKALQQASESLQSDKE
jgi:hypothetical protein